jgi:hypothetical protein
VGSQRNLKKLETPVVNFFYKESEFGLRKSKLKSSDAEAEAPEAVDLWWKRKRLKIFRFRSVSKLMFKFW